MKERRYPGTLITTTILSEALVSEAGLSLRVASRKAADKSQCLNETAGRGRHLERFQQHKERITPSEIISLAQFAIVMNRRNARSGWAAMNCVIFGEGHGLPTINLSVSFVHGVPSDVGHEATYIRKAFSPVQL